VLCVGDKCGDENQKAEKALRTCEKVTRCVEHGVSFNVKACARWVVNSTLQFAAGALIFH